MGILSCLMPDLGVSIRAENACPLHAPTAMPLSSMSGKPGAAPLSLRTLFSPPFCLLCGIPVCSGLGVDQFFLGLLDDVIGQLPWESVVPEFRYLGKQKPRSYLP